MVLDRAASGKAALVFVRLFLLAQVAVCAGCWQASQGRPAPDLTAQYEEVELTIDRLVRLGATVDDELADLRGRTGRFFDAPKQTWLAPFPLDAFKHAAMSCLNAPYNEAAPEPTVQEVADRLGITCAVPAAVDLERQLADVPSVRSSALARLIELDEVRSVRAKLQSRLRQLPSILRRTRAYVGTRRAESRQMVKEIQSKQGEYGRKSYDEAMKRIEEYDARLSVLEAQIGSLEDATGRWSRQLAEIVDALYKGLSRLGRL